MILIAFIQLDGSVSPLCWTHVVVLGRAYLGGLCDEYDVSVIEDTFAATVATTAAHELAHK